MKEKTTAPTGTNNKAELIKRKDQLGKELMAIEATVSGPSFLTASEEEKNVIMADRRAMSGYYEYLSHALRRIEKAEKETAKPLDAPPVMSPLIKERLENCGCIGCQITRELLKQEQEQAKATSETPPDDADICDCNACQLERKVAEMNKAQSMSVSELMFKKARQMPLFAFEQPGHPLSDNMAEALCDMMMKQAIKRIMGTTSTGKEEPVGMDPKADSFEAINKDPQMEPAPKVEPTPENDLRRQAVDQCEYWTSEIESLIDDISADSDSNYKGESPRPDTVLSSAERYVAVALLKEALVHLGHDINGWKTKKIGTAATLRIEQEHCPKCDWQGIYIRRRYFESMYSDVWMCNNDGCKMSGLYWHRDFQHAPKSQTNDQRQATASE